MQKSMQGEALIVNSTKYYKRKLLNLTQLYFNMEEALMLMGITNIRPLLQRFTEEILV